MAAKKKINSKKKTARKSRSLKKRSANTDRKSNPFKERKTQAAFTASKNIHVYGNNLICATNSRGQATPNNRSPAELVLDASEGFIPLWGKNVTLRWRFNEISMAYFENVDAAKSEIRSLFGEALLLWGDASPVRFTETTDVWDFELFMSSSDNCNSNGGCTLASAFFPDTGRHKLMMYPKMFTQSRKEQIDTFIHETGHIFGLRHFFAQISETQWASEIFGSHKPFGIMNYGKQSELAPDDKTDLARLYDLVWNHSISHINNTPVVQVRPYHELIFLSYENRFNTRFS